MRRHRVLFLLLILIVLILIGASRLLVAAAPTDGFFQSSDGVKIHYLEAGKATATGAPVILIHGFSGNAQGNWFANGVAEALAAKHWVIAIDCRGHGQSDKPHESEKYGLHMAGDVVELMNHLKIDKAHVHGYSMGGGITAQLLAANANRMVTASFGGSGVPEIDPTQREKTPADKPGPDPQEAEASAKLRAVPDRDEEALRACRGSWRLGDRSKLDLTKLTLPVLAINGEFDGPNAKTHRMQRELRDFKSVVLPGKSHLTAIMAGYIPPEYAAALVAFINAHDPSASAKSESVK